MNFSVTANTPDQVKTACLIVGMFEGRRPTPEFASLDATTARGVSALVRRSAFKGEAGKHLQLHAVPGISADSVLLVGLGARGNLSPERFQRAATAAGTTLASLGVRNAAWAVMGAPVDDRDLGWKAQTAVERISHACYQFTQMKSEDTSTPVPSRCSIVAPSRDDRTEIGAGTRRGEAFAAGVSLARDLGNLPGNVCTPTYLADAAKQLSERHDEVKTRVIEEAEMKRLGMGTFLSVSRGSRQPAKLIVMEYRGTGRADPPVVLIGKGVTFDSGGISMKPAAAMDEMKYDMCGAASVFGALEACVRMELALNVVVLVPATENLPDGDASKPGDIVTTLSGKTVEILNTDAEGRLILCDAMTYAERFEPAAIVDIATLTGACVVALGAHASGLFANDESLAQELLIAGTTAGDRAWQLPLWSEYEEQLKSNFADFANVGGRDGGAITAATFLAKFAREQRWAHLDIAGTAWKTGRDKGATGRPVGLLTQFLIARAGQGGG